MRERSPSYNINVFLIGLHYAKRYTFCFGMRERSPSYNRICGKGALGEGCIINVLPADNKKTLYMSTAPTQTEHPQKSTRVLG